MSIRSLSQGSPVVVLAAFVAASCTSLDGLRKDNVADASVSSDGGPDDGSSDSAATDAAEQDAASRDAASGPLQAFVSSKSYFGNQIPLTTADVHCATLATAAGLGSRWVAWLSASGSEAQKRVTGNGPWVRRDGVVIASTRAVLFSGALENALDQTETAGVVAAGSCVWTGTNRDGKDSNTDCSDWSTSSGSGTAGSAGALDPGGSWTDDDNVNCDVACRLYCFELP